MCARFKANNMSLPAALLLLRIHLSSAQMEPLLVMILPHMQMQGISGLARISLSCIQHLMPGLSCAQWGELKSIIAAPTPLRLRILVPLLVKYS